MKITTFCLLGLFLFVTNAQATPLTDETYLELLDASQQKLTLNKILDNNDAEMAKLGTQMLSTKGVSKNNLEACAKMQKRIHTLLESVMGYEVLSAQFKPMYMDNISEEEAKEIIKFYKTPAGQAIITKMPVIAQTTGILIMSKLDVVKQQALKIFDDYTKELTMAEPSPTNP